MYFTLAEQKSVHCVERRLFSQKRMFRHIFLTRIKQQGGLLAKGRLLGIQFDTLFTENLYLEHGRHAMNVQEKLKAILKKKISSFILIRQPIRFL
mgnify:CR=1 FL=1